MISNHFVKKSFWMSRAVLIMKPSTLGISSNANIRKFVIYISVFIYCATFVDCLIATPTKDISASKLKHSINVNRPELDKWREYDELTGSLDNKKLKKFFYRRPYLVSNRLLKVATILKTTLDEWESGTPSNSSAAYDFNYISEDEMDRVNTETSNRGVKLCERMSSLGPVAVKICQTLSQRADIVGDEAANALKSLQTANIQFDDKLAIAIIKESLNWDGPIAPNMGMEDSDIGKEPLFAWMSESPIAVASLGQVYKARTHEGQEIAVKVQRPDGIALLSTDFICFKLLLGAVDNFRKLQPGRSFDSGLLDCIVDRIATDMTEELNYIKEAKNGVKFEQSLNFLGFVKTPKVVKKYSTEKILVTEWVKGDHLNKLPKEQGLAMTRMAVEACTASIVLTGFVHADPHEGNLMLDEDGNIVFLDFGLMSDVSENVMEAFAQGIQGCLAEDWVELTKAFKATGFICDPIEWKPGDLNDEFEPVGIDPETGEDLGIAKLSGELGEAMKTVEGGTSRFGALATVLNQYLSDRWKMQTPPYVLLLIRTFLTLEGIAGRVDPDFNIYEMAMPWAVRRSLSPATKEGIATLRSTLLTKDNKIQWSRLLEMVEEATSSQQEAEKESSKEDLLASSAEQLQEDNAKSQSTESAKKAAMNDAVVTLLGSPEGVVLRNLLMDLDSSDLISRLLSKEGKILRHQAVAALSSPKEESSINNNTPSSTDASSNIGTSGNTDIFRPVSEESAQLRERQMKWTNKVVSILVREHLKRQIRAGPLAVAKFAVLSLRVVVGVVHQNIRNKLRRVVRRFKRRRQRRSTSTKNESLSQPKSDILSTVSQ